MDLTSRIPKSMAKTILGWNNVYLSPLSNSYYNMKIDDGYFPIGCVRVSDHWNFFKDNSIRCKTDRPLMTGLWAMAKWDGNVWTVSKVSPQKNLTTLRNYKLKEIDNAKTN